MVSVDAKLMEVSHCDKKIYLILCKCCWNLCIKSVSKEANGSLTWKYEHFVMDNVSFHPVM